MTPTIAGCIVSVEELLSDSSDIHMYLMDRMYWQSRFRYIHALVRTLSQHLLECSCASSSPPPLIMITSLMMAMSPSGGTAGLGPVQF